MGAAQYKKVCIYLFAEAEYVQFLDIMLHKPDPSISISHALGITPLSGFIFSSELYGTAPQLELIGMQISTFKK